MRRQALLMVPVSLLAACDRPEPAPDARNDAVHVAADDGKGVSVSVPGLDARLSLPGMDLSRHVDLDGVRLAPGTRVGSMDVAARDKDGGGAVSIRFASPRPPAALVVYYRAETARAGFTDVRDAAGSLQADRNGRRFALTVAPAGTGSAGTISMTGG